MTAIEVLQKLRAELVEEQKYYKKGVMMSMAESIHGESTYKEVIAIVDRMIEELSV